MPSSITIDPPVIQQSATTTLSVAGIGTNFPLSGGPFTASAGNLMTQLVVSATSAGLVFTAPAGPASVTFTDTGSGATFDVRVMALPILERIRQNLLATLQTIGVGSGYFTTPIVQPILQANGDADNLIILGLGESELIAPPTQKIYIKQTFYALCYVLPSDADAGEAIDPQLLYLYADVFKAIYVDRTRGSLAYDTVMQPPQFESNAEEAQFRVVIPIHVLYRTLENDPTALG